MVDIKDLMKKTAILTISGVATYYAIKYIDERFPGIISKIKEKISPPTKSVEVKDITITSDKREIYEGDSVLIRYYVKATEYPVNLVIISSGKPLKSIKANETGMVKLTFSKAGRYNIQVCSQKVCSNTIAIVVKPKSQKPTPKPSPSPSPTQSPQPAPKPSPQPQPSPTQTPSPSPSPTKTPPNIPGIIT